MLSKNPALIFPKAHYKPWDKLPEFQLLDGNFDKMIPKSVLKGEFTVLQKNPNVNDNSPEKVVKKSGPPSLALKLPKVKVA